jgi:hypothetical protein
MHNISFILRKPEPLGTEEFKIIACAVTGMLAAEKHHGGWWTRFFGCLGISIIPLSSIVLETRHPPLACMKQHLHRIH